jgi:signal transduction histidine kinase
MRTLHASSILIVEDEPIVAKDLQYILRDMGFNAYAIANSADEALKRASEHCPDLVLMDIRIKGGLDGIQTAELLRTRFDVPVVYLTAHADEATIERAAATEPFGYLLKPIKEEELLSAIEIALRRRQAEKSVRDRERWFATAVRAVHDAVITTGSHGEITFLNPAAESLTGLRCEEAMGKPASEVLRRLNQEDVVAQTMTAAVGDALGGTVIVLHDVREKQRLQKQLELADRLSSLGAMAATTAHELNNPLTVVMTNSGLIGESLNQLRAQLGSHTDTVGQMSAMLDALGDLQAAASRMARIVGDLRNFSRPAADKPERLDLRRCVEWAVRATAREFQYRAILRTRFEPAPFVIGEPARIEQVLVNLLVNAAHAIPPGHVDDNEVQVNVGVSEDGRARIEVRDTGAGIAPDLVDRIFDPFFTTKAPEMGTGLGLAICQGIVHALGGEIRVNSTVGKGTTFTILLKSAEADELASPPSGAEPQPKAAPGRILVMDDEVTLLRAIQRILQDEGHTIVACSDASAGLAHIDAGEQFDLVISDLMMPGMTGLDFYELLKRRHPAATHKVVFITGGALTPQVATFLESIPNSTLEKPFKLAQLIDTVNAALRGTPGTAASGETLRPIN